MADMEHEKVDKEEIVDVVLLLLIIVMFLILLSRGPIELPHNNTAPTTVELTKE
jgi:hypothetical protein